MIKKLSPDQIAGIRQPYADGVALNAIAEEFGVTNSTISYWADGGPAKGAAQLTPLARRKRGPGKRVTLRGGRRATINRLWRTAAHQVRDIEERLESEGQPPDERERDARMLAILSKTLRELATFDLAYLEKSKKDAPRDDDDAVPADIDDLRRELARRVDLIRQRGSADGGAGGDAA
jgi:hypothetical protein